MTVEKLTIAGYEFIGMDHFAKPDDDLAKAFQEKRFIEIFKVTAQMRAPILYAMGITSISQFGKSLCAEP